MSSLEASAHVAAPPEAVFDYLADLENHWRLADRWIEVLSLERSGPGAPAHGGEVRMRGPLGVGRTATTAVVEAERPRRMAGSAEVGNGTLARISWDLEPDVGGTRVRLAAELDSAGPLDRAVLTLGGAAWMRRRFASVLERLAARFESG